MSKRVHEGEGEQHRGSGGGSSAELVVLSNSLVKVFGELCKKKQKVSNAEVDPLVNESSFLLVELKKANRKLYLEEEQLKTESQNSKQKLDDLNLQLQNLLYEKNNLKKEILRCRDYKPKHKDVPLVPEDVFLETAPEELTKAIDPHQRMLNRLTFELQERKNKVKQLEELATRKKLFVDMTTARMKLLEGFASRIQTITKASQQLQKDVQSQISDDLKNTTNANLLPQALYTLFFQASVYKETFDTSVQVSISGSPEEPLTALGKNSVPATKKKAEDSKKSALDISPLSVIVDIPVDDPKSKVVSLKFEYLPQLNILVASCPGNPSGFLLNLFPNDSGYDSPNPYNKLLPEANGVAIEETLVPRPYKWAQWLGGLDFLSAEQDARLNRNYSLSAIFEQLRRRVKYSNALQAQLDSLGKLNVPSSVRSISFPHQVSSTLQIWTEVNRNAFEKDEEHQANSAVWEKQFCKYFKAVLKKDKALIEISPEYPIRAPLFKLNLLTKESPEALPQVVKEKADAAALDSTQIATFDNNVKSMEIEVNSNYGKFVPDGEPHELLLSYQLYRLQMCLDVFVESTQHVDNFKQGKTLVRPIRGRNRAYQIS